MKAKRKSQLRHLVVGIVFIETQGKNAKLPRDCNQPLLVVYTVYRRNGCWSKLSEPGVGFDSVVSRKDARLENECFEVSEVRSQCLVSEGNIERKAQWICWREYVLCSKPIVLLYSCSGLHRHAIYTIHGYFDYWLMLQRSTHHDVEVKIPNIWLRVFRRRFDSVLWAVFFRGQMLVYCLSDPPVSSPFFRRQTYDRADVGNYTGVEESLRRPAQLLWQSVSPDTLRKAQLIHLLRQVNPNLHVCRRPTVQMSSTSTADKGKLNSYSLSTYF